MDGRLKAGHGDEAGMQKRPGAIAPGLRMNVATPRLEGGPGQHGGGAEEPGLTIHLAMGGLDPPIQATNTVSTDGRLKAGHGDEQDKRPGAHRSGLFLLPS
jgi:hypothetical protein